MQNLPLATPWLQLPKPSLSSPRGHRLTQYTRQIHLARSYSIFYFCPFYLMHSHKSLVYCTWFKLYSEGRMINFFTGFSVVLIRCFELALCNFLAFGKAQKGMPLCGILELLPCFTSAGIDQTFPILASRCKPLAACRAKLKEMRHTLKQVIFTDICLHQNGKIRDFKEIKGYAVEVLSQVHVSMCLS